MLGLMKNLALASIRLGLAVTLLSASPAASKVVTQKSVETVNGKGIEVYSIFDDSVKDRRPGVLVFHHILEGVNGYIQSEAKRLAELGYFVMAPSLATSADFGGAKDIHKLTAPQSERYKRLVDTNAAASLVLIRKSPHVNTEKVAIVGFCHLGGPAAMKLARRSTANVLAGVATFWGGIQPMDHQVAWKDRHVEPKILVLLGGKDVETNPFLQSFQDEMRATSDAWRMIIYGPAQHAFTITGYKGDRGEYHAESARLAWRELTLFLEDLFKSA